MVNSIIRSPLLNFMVDTSLVPRQQEISLAINFGLAFLHAMILAIAN